MGFTIGLIQMNSGTDKARNLETAARLIEEAAGKGARLISLPEMFNWLGPDGDRVAQAEDIEDGETARLLRHLARKHGVYLHGGSILERANEPGKCHNTSLVIGPSGQTLARYRKMHLFDVELGSTAYRESDHTVPGDRAVRVETELGTLGLTICYDLRFPELYRTLALAGAHLILVPAAFTLQTGKDHWEPLLRARAIENQVWVAAAAQVGIHPPGRACYGNSMAVDPWGTVTARASEREMALLAEVDLSLIQRVRGAIPCLDHRVPRVYKL